MTILRSILPLLLILLAGCRAPAAMQNDRVTPSPAVPVTVFVYFTDSNQNVPAGPQPVQRQIRAATVEDRLSATLESLLEGPTESERQAGLDSWFSGATAGMLQEVTIAEDGAASISFRDFSRIIPNASTSAGSGMLLSQLHATVFQFPEVQAVTYQFNGSCDAFWNWLQAACQQVSRDDWLMTH
jgi:spore germination protein GerM